MKTRNIRFNLFLSEEEKKMLDDVADGLGLTASGAVRQLVRDAYQDFDEDDEEDVAQR